MGSTPCPLHGDASGEAVAGATCVAVRRRRRDIALCAGDIDQHGAARPTGHRNGGLEMAGETPSQLSRILWTSREAWHGGAAERMCLAVVGCQ